MSRMRRKGFTIIELMMVIAIIGVLSGIVMSIATGAMRSARSKRTETMRVLWESAIATYYAQDPDGKWPDEIDSLAREGKSGVLTESDAQKVFRKIVKRSIGKDGHSPLIDPTGLFVARSGIRDGKGTGLVYDDARHGDGTRRQPIGPDQMDFGYQGRLTGKFHRFNIIYHAQSDSVKVTTCCHDCAKTDGCKRPADGDNPCPICHANE